MTKKEKVLIAITQRGLMEQIHRKIISDSADAFLFGSHGTIGKAKSKEDLNQFMSVQTFADGSVKIPSCDNLLEEMKEIGRIINKAKPIKTIRYSDLVTSPTKRRLFPESRHRSKRILKKLLKRYHGEYEREPAIIEAPDAIYCHSSFRERIENHGM